MAIEPIPWSSRVLAVRVPVRDEQMGDILSTTETHFAVVAGAHSDLLQYAGQTGQRWLVRADAALVFPRTNGAFGSLFPDLLVAFDAAVDANKPYRIDKVGHPPEFLLEALSDETAAKDEDPVEGKLGAYAEMGVREYLTFDPRPRKHLALNGYRLVRPGVYAPIPVESAGGLWLETLQLRVVAEPGGGRPRRGPLLRFYTADGTPVLHRDETEAQWRAEQAARQAAERRRVAAERQRKEAERQRKAAERREALERAARLEAERKLAELEARLARHLSENGPPADGLDRS